MNCEQVQELLWRRLDAEADDEQRRLLDAHLESCEFCRFAEESFRNEDRALRRVFAPRRQAAAAVAERVVRRIDPSAASLRRAAGWMPLALAAAAGFLLAVLLFPPWDSERGIPGSGELHAGDPYEKGGSPRMRLALATGLVETLSPGAAQWRPLATGGAIQLGTKVRTTPETRCEFQTADGSTLRLNFGTEIALASERSFDLAKGQLWSRVAPSPKPFEVAVSEVSVTALGTEFDLRVREKETVLTVLEGATKVRGTIGEETVRAGESARIVEGRVEGKNPVRDLILATSWVHELLLLRGRDGEELGKRVDEMLARIGRTKMAYLYEEEIRALGDHCVLPLTRFIQSDDSRKEPRQRVDAARILSDIAQPWAIAELISLLRDENGDIRYFAARALSRLTGRNAGLSPEQFRDLSSEACGGGAESWESWWEQNKHRYPSPPTAILPRSTK